MSELYRCAIETLGVLVVGGEFGGYIDEVGRGEEGNGEVGGVLQFAQMGFNEV